MAVLDAQRGPIYVDEGAEIQPFTRIEGPCYVGRGAILVGAECRGGNSIGPFCRVGGEVEASILQGFANKYHDGLLGHAYVGQWVNLGAMTNTTTDSAKRGALIGDHAKTAIGTLLNSRANVGAMTLLVGRGGLLPRHIPSFTWYLNGVLVPGTGKARWYATARTVLARRQCEWTEADEALWDAVHQMTDKDREEAIRRSAKEVPNGNPRHAVRGFSWRISTNSNLHTSVSPPKAMQ
jgi:carbonic anhydrase/acetyltransferase-like protein (isoleucine patch superfamily)